MNQRVVSINVGAHVLTLGDGRLVKYGKCLIATGSRPKFLHTAADAGSLAPSQGNMTSQTDMRDPTEIESSRIMTFRTVWTADPYNFAKSLKLDDYKKAQRAAVGNKKIAVIGGGFLGSELACSLAFRAKMNDALSVTQIFAEEGWLSVGFLF